MNKFITTIFLFIVLSSTAIAGTVVYAIDGTSKNIKHGAKTNVYHFVKAYRAKNKNAITVYAGGVGTIKGDKKLPHFLNIPGKISGVGGRKIVNKMYSQLVKNFKKGHKGIVIVGFSRGAALSREFAHVIKERGNPLKYRKGKKTRGKAPKIKFMGLFDTVYSFGIPFGKKDLTYRKSIPSNVLAVAHATAKLEKRNTFDLWSIHTKKKYLNRKRGSLKKGNYRAEKQFNGGHDDIGGAKKYNYYGLAPLKWIIKEGRKASISLATPKKKHFKKKNGQKPKGNGLGKRQIYFPKRGK